MEEPNTTTEQPPVYDVGLNLKDIQNVLKIIDHACDQGAFRGWEVIEQVQYVRKRLNTFIGAALAAQEAAKSAPDLENE